MKYVPHDYQRYVTDYIKTHPTCAVLLDMGLGKTSITLTAIDLKKFSRFSMICYILMGWCILIRIDLIHTLLGPRGFWLLLLGGLAYTLGAVLYGLGKKRRYMHAAFHVFTVVGSLLQFLCIILYVL